MREVREAIDPPRPGARRPPRTEQTESVAKSFKVGKTGVLDLNHFSGTVTITGGAGEEMSIDAVKRVRAQTPEEAKKQFEAIRSP